MIDPGSVALGALASLIGWSIFIFIIFLPALKRTKKEIKEDIKRSLPEMTREAVPIIKEAIKDELPDFEKDLLPKIKAEIPDFEKDIIPKLKAELKKELPEIPSIDEISDTAFMKIMEKLSDDKDKDVDLIFKMISARVVYGAMSIVENDEHVKHWIAGNLSAAGKSVAKGIETMIDNKAKAFGVDLSGKSGEGMPGGMPDMDLDKMIKYGMWKFISKKLG